MTRTSALASICMLSKSDYRSLRKDLVSMKETEDVLYHFDSITPTKVARLRRHFKKHHIEITKKELPEVTYEILSCAIG